VFLRPFGCVQQREKRTGAGRGSQQQAAIITNAKIMPAQQNSAAEDAQRRQGMVMMLRGVPGVLEVREVHRDREDRRGGSDAMLFDHRSDFSD